MPNENGKQSNYLNYYQYHLLNQILINSSNRLKYRYHYSFLKANYPQSLSNRLEFCHFYLSLKNNYPQSLSNRLEFNHFYPSFEAYYPQLLILLFGMMLIWKDWSENFLQKNYRFFI